MDKRRKLTNTKHINPYDLNRLGIGFNQPCSKCSLPIDRRTSPYETIGFIKYCKCNIKRKNNGMDS